MVKEIRYTSIRRVLDNILDHPMMSGLTLEQVVRHTIRFISINGFPRLYQDRQEVVDIHEFRGLLPCDLISIIQVKNLRTHLCMRSMTDSFNAGLAPHDTGHRGNHRHPLPPPPFGEDTWKTQGRVIFTSFPEGRVEIAYKAIPVDEDGFPLLIDNENYLAALEAYIKKQVFTVKFDQGKIAAGVLQNAQTEYAFLAGQLQSEFTIPSYSEVQSLQNAVTALIPRMTEFYTGFRHEGNLELIRKHDNRR